MENVRGYYDKGKIVVDLRCYLPCHLLVSSFIQQEETRMRKIVILAHYKLNFIKEHENLVQDISAE